LSQQEQQQLNKQRACRPTTVSRWNCMSSYFRLRCFTRFCFAKLITKRR